MRINKHSKIESVCSDDKSRPSIQNAWLDAEKGRIIATNGKIMAIVEITTDEGDVTGPITPDAIKAARKEARRSELSIQANGSLVLPSGVSLPRPSVGEEFGQVPPFPNCDAVWPSDANPIVFQVGLDAELLLKLALALSKDGEAKVRLKFTSSDEVIQVTGTNRLAKGLLMPTKTL